MGEKEEKQIKVVLDTNVLVSALLFRGKTSRLVDLWKMEKILPVFSKETFEEFLEVLHYPKFSLTEKEIKTIVEEEVLPFFDVVDEVENLPRVCKDEEDDKFIACALASSADLIVSGDRNLLEIERYGPVKIVNTADFLKMLDV